jgi:hypothetical protein
LKNNIWSSAYKEAKMDDGTKKGVLTFLDPSKKVRFFE